MFDVKTEKPFWERLLDRDARRGPMPERFSRNRNRLVGLANRLGTFSTREIITPFRAGGDTVIGDETPQEVLQTLFFVNESGRWQRR